MALTFPSTRWSLIDAVNGEDPVQSKQAIDALTGLYCTPLYGYLRDLGHDATAAMDILQAFFETHFTQRPFFADLAARNGKFRNWLRVCARNFANTERKRATRSTTVPVMYAQADARYASLQHHALSPEQLYDRLCAETLVDQTLVEIEADYQRQGKLELFFALVGMLPGRHPECSYAESAGRLGMQENQLRAHMNDLRKTFGKRVMAHLRRGRSSRQEAEEEFKYLLGLLA